MKSYNKIFQLFPLLILLLMVASCDSGAKEGTETGNPETDKFLYETTKFEAEGDDFLYKTEQFADLKIIRYQVPGFDELDLNQKKMLYYLYEAALSGRDIIYDQNYRHNLVIRRTLEAIWTTYNGDKSGVPWQAFEVYTKRVWFANGIHHHYFTKKLEPGFDYAYFEQLVKGSDESALPLEGDQTVDDLLATLKPVIFDPNVDAKRVNKGSDVDKLTSSANNFYEGVTEAEATAFYDGLGEEGDDTPPSYGLNSKLVKENGEVKEQVWKVGGMYSDAISEIVGWLKKASEVAENPTQKAHIDLLIEYYETGDLKKFDEYNIAWVKDTDSRIDVVNGFIEVYGDPLGYKGSFESVVSIRDMEATKRIDAISKEAQWFEDNSSIMDEHKKEKVVGISAKVITVVMEAGDASPSTPIGINLPNANWIRRDHGSKSVNLGNIVAAYDEASRGGGFLQEFAYSEEEIEMTKKWGTLADNLHTDMHEVIGHASGQINPGIGTPKETLKQYSSTLEEARADLVALYYLMDEKLIEIGVMETTDVGKVAFNDYVRNGAMTQLRRIEPGEDIEEDHMRNRQLNVMWAYEKGKADNVIERVEKEGKTYFVINDYEKLRELWGELLREIQRIKSEGDFNAAQELVETYGVKVDQDLHAEVLERTEKLNIAPYGGFINPKLVPVMEGDEIIDVKVEYPADFSEQHLEYSNTHSFLPNKN